MPNQADAPISDLRVSPIAYYNIGKKVQRTVDGCLLWLGSTTMNGYGVVHIDKKPYLVHRVAYYLAYGNFTGMVLHSCDRRRCIEPTHLHLGDHAMNTQEAVARGRHWAPTGEEHHLTHITEDDVREIRRLKGVVPRRELAARYRIAPNNVSGIQAKRSWKHVGN